MLSDNSVRAPRAHMTSALGREPTALGCDRIANCACMRPYSTLCQVELRARGRRRLSLSPTTKCRLQERGSSVLSDSVHQRRLSYVALKCLHGIRRLRELSVRDLKRTTRVACLGFCAPIWTGRDRMRRSATHSFGTVSGSGQRGLPQSVIIH